MKQDEEPSAPVALRLPPDLVARLAEDAAKAALDLDAILCKIVRLYYSLERH
jgi:hypothetical protein